MIPPSQHPSLPSSAYSTRPPSPSTSSSVPRTSIPSGANRLPLPQNRRLPAFIQPVAMSSTLSTSSAPPGPPLHLSPHPSFGYGHSQGPGAGLGQARPAASRSASTRLAQQYVKPFKVPTYLKHSAYYDQFFTTPEPIGPYSPLLDLAPSASLHPSASAPASTPVSSANLPSLARHHSGTVGPIGYGKDDHQPRKLRPRLSDGLLGATAREGASGVPHTSPATPILLPTCWDADDRCALLDVGGDGLNVSFGGSAKYGDRDAAAVRANRPIPPQCGVYYFEVTIQSKGQSGYIGIGLSQRSVKLSRLPGWEPASWGYHGDDGRSFCCHGTGEVFGPTFSTGDVIGCGVDWTGVGPKSETKEQSGPGPVDKNGGRCFFTKNGEFIGYAFSNLTGNLYPSVGLRTPGEVVRANFGSEPFRFDINRLVRERQRLVLAQIHQTAIPASLRLPPKPSAAPIPTLFSSRPGSAAAAEAATHETIQELIGAYLAHHGYSHTAEAFAKQRAEEREERTRGLLVGGPKIKLESEDGDAVGGGKAEDDAAARGQIRALLLEGDALGALAKVEAAFPEALVDDPGDEGGGVRFKLRVRGFVEAYKAATSGAADSSVLAVRGKARASSATDEDAAMSDGEGSVASDSDPWPMHAVMTLGRDLAAAYMKDPRPAVQAALQQAFSLVAYADPATEGGPEAAWLLSQAARERVAEEVNGAVLVAMRMPAVPELEGVWRQAGAVVRCLGDNGVGGAALVRVGEALG